MEKFAVFDCLSFEPMFWLSGAEYMDNIYERMAYVWGGGQLAFGLPQHMW